VMTPASSACTRFARRRLLPTLLVSMLGCTPSAAPSTSTGGKAASSAAPAASSADLSSRPSLDDPADLADLWHRADACVLHTSMDGGVCGRTVKTTVVLDVAPDGAITHAVVPNQGQLELPELECIGAVFAHTRFTRLPRPAVFHLPIEVCR
jgi:hypothetical protein